MLLVSDAGEVSMDTFLTQEEVEYLTGRRV